MISPDPAALKIRFALFASGANFSCYVLQHLYHRNCPPDLIVLPDYPAARVEPGSALNFKSPTSTNPLLALSKNIPIQYAPRSGQAALITVLKEQPIDYLLVACWPYLIDAALTQCPMKAALNLHPSLLPRYRGPNPVEMQIASQEIRLGVSLHLLSDRFDRGDIVMQAELDPGIRNDDRSIIEEQCAQAGVDLFIDAATDYERGWNLLRQQSNHQ